MESVAWVEVLGPRGQVLHRHPAFAWPIRIGNTYDGDIVVDDPAFPASLISLELSAGNEPEMFFELASAIAPVGIISRLRVNGKSFEPLTANAARLLGDDVVEFGATRIRVRLRGHDVTRLKSNARGRFVDSWAFAWLVAVTAAIWYGYFTAINSLDEEASAQFREAFLFVIVLLIWWGGWTLISRLATGYGHAREHLLTSGIMFALFSNCSSAGSALAFATGMTAFATAGQIAQMAAVYFAMFAHLRLVKPVGVAMSILRAGVLPCIVWLWLLNGIDMVFPQDQAPISYDASIWPASMAFSSGGAAQDILTSLDDVKTRVDEAAKGIAKRVNEDQ